MISFSRLGRLGRLGNQLFHIAATKGIAERNNTGAIFPPWQYQQYFTDEFLTLPIPPNQEVYTEPGFHYTEPHVSQHTDLNGYFQSAKYFPKDYKPTFDRRYLDMMRAKLPMGENICIHIRRGDYVGHKEYYQLPPHWFVSALLTIDGWEKKNVIIVSDDLPYCRVHFECLPNAHFIPGTEIEHLILMSLCDYHIISNSSFSWWGAYLSNSKRVIHSGELFRGSYAAKDTKDFYPAEWECQPVRKIPLPDVTFTIPVMYDHADRKQNLDLSLCILQQTYEGAKYMVMEQGGDKFAYIGEFADYLRSDSKVFHRTKMLNDMATRSETEYIVNWDCDVFIPPMQMMQSMAALRSGVAVSYPYDGRFARLERVMFKPLQTQLDIGISAGQVFKGKNGRPMPETSVGGAVIWNRDAFIDAGMENEYFISFGPEDVERWERMNKLGLNPHRAGGCLYHMNHYIGPDSSKANPHFAANHRELDKMRKMNGTTLREYIGTWPWRHRYTPAYYARIAEGAIRSAKVFDQIFGFSKGSVLDLGCGIGEWSLGNPQYIGVDYGSPIKRLMIPQDNYIDCNLEKELPLIPYKMDWAICLEVAEHITEERADAIVDFLCSSCDNILFGAAIPNQGGEGHVNEQWQTYWAKKLYRNGFGGYNVNDQWDLPNVEPWYQQNACVFFRDEPNQQVRDFVLPSYYEQIVQHFKNLAKA